MTRSKKPTKQTLLFGKQRLVAVVHVRVTEGEKAKLDRAALEAGRSLSDYMRRRALGELDGAL